MKYLITIGFLLWVTDHNFTRAGNEQPVTEWVAPASAQSVANPFEGNEYATAEGKKIYTQICIVCHGPKGKGDGVGGLALNPRPANFGSPRVQQQTDGALFWKITEGRPPMASYKTTLTEAQRWYVINFIRTFKPIKK